MQNVWPIKSNKSSWFLAIALMPCTLGLLYLCGVTYPDWAWLAILASVFPFTYVVMLVLYRIRARYDSEKWRSVLREGATPLGRGQAFLTLSADASELHCNLEGGQFARLALLTLTNVRLEAPKAQMKNWHLRLDRAGDYPHVIRFDTPRDAESWLWRILQMRPELGLETERLRAVDVFISEDAELPPTLERDWGNRGHAKRKSEEQLVLSGVTPEFADGFIRVLDQAGIASRQAPSGTAAASPLLRVEASSLSIDRPKAEQEPLVVTERTLIDFLGLTAITAVVALFAYVAQFGIEGVMMLSCIVILIPLGTLTYWNRRKKLKQLGLNPNELLATDIATNIKRGTFVMIPTHGTVGFRSHRAYQEGEGVYEDEEVRRFHLADVTRVHLAKNDLELVVEVTIRGQKHPAHGSAPDMENLFCQWMAGLHGNPNAPHLPLPQWQIVMVTSGDLSVDARLKLRDEWLNLDHLTAGRPLPTGPLVGPVSPEFAAALIEFLQEHGGRAHAIPYLVTDPKPFCPAPGRPWISSLIGRTAALPPSDPEPVADPGQ